MTTVIEKNLSNINIEFVTTTTKTIKIVNAKRNDQIKPEG